MFVFPNEEAKKSKKLISFFDYLASSEYLIEKIRKKSNHYMGMFLHS